MAMYPSPRQKKAVYSGEGASDVQGREGTTIRTRVAVIGGGIAGLACACDLADAGVEVVVLEAKKHLGGRAYSFQDRESGACIDNCQHVLLGCCDEATSFFERVGSAERLEFRDAIRMVSGDGRDLRIMSSPLPAPLHLAPSFIKSSYLPVGQKLGLARALALMVKRAPVNGMSAADYLMAVACPAKAVERVVEPILVSALNEELASASAHDARMVLLKSLVESRTGYRLGVFRGPLTEVLGAPATRYLAMRGCQMRTSAKVERLNISGGRVSSIGLQDGGKVRCGAYVIATPPWSVAEMGLGIPGIDAIAWRSIVGVHLFLDEIDSRFECACVAGEAFGWVFNKTADFGMNVPCVQAVASAADGIVDRPKDDLVEMAMRAAGKASGRLKNAGLKRAVVYRAKRATFSTSRASGINRPATFTDLDNVFLAGDWTDTGWPSTMESAVRSGRAAARAVLGRL